MEVKVAKKALSHAILLLNETGLPLEKAHVQVRNAIGAPTDIPHSKLPAMHHDLECVRQQIYEATSWLRAVVEDID